MSSIPTLKGTTGASVTRTERAAEAYTQLTLIEKINVDAKNVVKLAPKVETTTWVRLELHGYKIRVTQRDLNNFVSATAGQADETEWQDFLLEAGQTRFNEEWIPICEALRLDDEAAAEMDALEVA